MASVTREKTRVANVYKIRVNDRALNREVIRYEINLTRKLADGRTINYQKRHDTQAAAEYDRDRVISEIRAGTFIPAADRKPSVQSAFEPESPQTLGDALLNFITYKNRVNALPLCTRETNRLKFLARHPALAQIRLPELENDHLNEFIAARLGDGASRSTIKKDVANLQRWRKLATKAELGGMTEGLWRHDYQLCAADPRTRRPTEIELARVFADLDDRPGWAIWVKRAARLAVLTGMRRGELCSALWKNLDRAARLLHLASADTKGRVFRSVPLSDEALDLLKSLEAEQRGPEPQKILGGLPVDMLSKGWLDACRRQHIDNLHFHDLRAFAITQTARKPGLTIAELQVFSGHATLSQLQVYLRLDAESVARKL